MSEREQLLLPIADDGLVLGWRNSEWTSIAPFLEEDVAFSSIAQNEIGHARGAVRARRRGGGRDLDELAFDQSPVGTATRGSSSSGSSRTGRGRSLGVSTKRRTPSGSRR